MKRLLVTFLILGLVAGSVATAEAKKRKKPARVERTVEGSYDSPWMFVATTCADSGGDGCVSVATQAREAFFTAKVTDAHGQPVYVHVASDNDGNDGVGEVRELGSFCGETTQPIAFDRGVTLRFSVGVSFGWVDPGICAPGIATIGTISVTLSNLP